MVLPKQDHCIAANLAAGFMPLRSNGRGSTAKAFQFISFMVPGSRGLAIGMMPHARLALFLH
jgi:hypothetical protein